MSYATSKNVELVLTCVYIDTIGFSRFSLNIDITVGFEAQLETNINREMADVSLQLCRDSLFLQRGRLISL